MERTKQTANIYQPDHKSKGHCKNHGHRSSDVLDYLEPHDKSYSQPKTFYGHRLKTYVPECIQGFSHFRCIPCLIDYYRAHLCGKEWCLICGAKMSWIHLRRMARWWDKWEQLKTLGYLVVTTPIELRKYILSLDHGEAKKVLQHLRRYWVRKLKAEFDGIKGLCRYHWTGEDGIEFSPHLNFLFNHSFIEKATLNRWRGDYYQWIKDMYHLENASGTTVINYRYYTKRTDRIHKIKYVTRATLKVNNPRISKIIYRFKNSINFGKFDKPKKNKKALSSLEACRCPGCQTKLEHIEFVRPSRLYTLPMSINELDGGWFKHSSLDRGS